MSDYDKRQEDLRDEAARNTAINQGNPDAVRQDMARRDMNQQLDAVTPPPAPDDSMLRPSVENPTKPFAETDEASLTSINMDIHKAGAVPKLEGDPIDYNQVAEEAARRTPGSVPIMMSDENAQRLGREIESRYVPPPAPLSVIEQLNVANERIRNRDGAGRRTGEDPRTGEGQLVREDSRSGMQPEDQRLYHEPPQPFNPQR